MAKWLYMQMLLACDVSQCAHDVKCLNDSPTWTWCAGLTASLTARASFFCLESPAFSYTVCPRYWQCLTAAVMALTLAITGDGPDTLHHRTVSKRPVLSSLSTPVMSSGVNITLTNVISPVKGNCYLYYKVPRHVTTPTQCTRVNPRRLWLHNHR